MTRLCGLCLSATGTLTLTTNMALKQKQAFGTNRQTPYRANKRDRLMDYNKLLSGIKDGISESWVEEYDCAPTLARMNYIKK